MRPMKLPNAAAKLWIPLAVFVFLASGFSGVWWMNRRHGEQLLETQCRIIATQSASRLEEGVRVRMALVQQLRAEWLLQPYTSEQSFQHRVQPILDQFPGYLAINWVDPNGIIRWAVPPGPNRAALGKDLHFHPTARETFIRAERTGTDQMTPPITLYQGGTGIAAYFPIREGHKNLGYLNAVFRITPMVRRILGPSVLNNYAVRIMAGGQTLFTNERTPLSGWQDRVSPVPIRVANLRRKLFVFPTGTAPPTRRQAINLLLLLAGMLFAGAISVLTGQALSAHQRLRESEARYRDLFERSMDAIYITSPDGRFLDCNQAAVQLFHARDREQLLDVDIGASLYQEPADRRHLMERLRRDGAAQDYPLRLKTLDGSPIFARVSETVSRGAGGEITAIQGILHDETEAHRMQEELIRVQRLESMSELAGGIAHDFNNVLAAIMTNASMLELGLDDPAKRVYTQRIQASVKSAARLTGQLLEFSRGSLSAIEIVDINQLVDETLLILERSIDPNITVKRELAEHLPAVEGDPGRLQQILLNLLVNARDALPGGGIITISTSPSDPPSDRTDPAIVPGELDSRRWIELSVSDTGVGMDDHTLKRIFEPFFTTKGRGKGTGLGLAVAYGIVRDHGGLIRVTSSPGTGTTFHVFLPAAAGKVAPRTPPSTEETVGGTETILLVDDDDEVRAGLAAVLRSAGYSVREARDGLEALDVFHRDPRAIDAVVLDMTMPGPNGIEVLQKLRSMAPGIPVILSTGHSTPGLSRDLERPDAVLHKPYEREVLLNTLHDILKPRRDRSSVE